jgi:hypothetical protein
MDWTSLIGPAVVAAAISSLVSGIGIYISARTTRAIHSEKLAFDREQGERRAAAELSLAERKSTADIALAEKKLAFDKALGIWRRRYELAEQVLSTSYEARDVFMWVRSPAGFTGEGETRKAGENEGDKLRERRDSYFVPVERLTREKKIFSTIQALRYAVAAHFGADAVKPLSAITEVYHAIPTAAEILIQLTHDDDDHRSVIQNMAPLLETLGRKSRPDATDKKIADAIEQIEAFCRPVLSATLPI